VPKRVLFLETKENPQILTLLFEKEAVKTFFYNASPKFLSRKISPEKSLDFWSQKSVRRYYIFAISFKKKVVSGTYLNAKCDLQISKVVVRSTRGGT